VYQDIFPQKQGDFKKNLDKTTERELIRYPLLLPSHTSGLVLALAIGIFFPCSTIGPDNPSCEMLDDEKCLYITNSTCASPLKVLGGCD